MFKIAVLPGDGIGPEIVAQAVKCLKAVGNKFGTEFYYEEAPIGGVAIAECGEPMPKATMDLMKRSDAALFGAAGDPKYDHLPKVQRPEQALFDMRKGFDLFANLRPVKVLAPLASTSTVKEEIIKNVDLVVVRELTSGLYFGQPSERRQTPEGWEAVDTLYYNDREIERVIRAGFDLARKRRKKLTSVDKSNVLATSRLWEEIANRVAPDYPDVEFNHLLVDACAMYLVRQPSWFDVIVTENTFGDILTDEASMLAGSMGMLPSASVGIGKYGLYEPIHGSAPRHAGKNDANPLATILSAAMMLELSFDLPKQAKAIEDAVLKALNDGYRTYDIMQSGMKQVGTSEMGDAVAERIIAG